MNQRLGAEERIALWLAQEAPGDPPDRVVQAAFERTRTMRQERLPLLGRIVVSRRAALLLVAILLVAASVIGYVVGGARPVFLTGPIRDPDRLALVRGAGVLRVAVRPDSPQAMRPDGTVDGFDVDVAREVARRLGVGIEIVSLSPTDMLTAPDRWDLGLPSTTTPSIDATAFVLTTPYYDWRRELVVPAGSGATSVDDVRGQPFCAVDGDAGERWLLGADGSPAPGRSAAPPIPSSLILRASDAACLDALTAGAAAAMVTATLTPEDLATRAGFRSIDGPPVEPRAAIVARDGPDPTALVAAVEQALSDMRRDGTLARLSVARFGADLTARQP